jgi:hypothetical protein
MQSIDLTIEKIKDQLAVLEKKKQEEIKQEEEKRKFPLQVIEEIIEQKKEKKLKDQLAVLEEKKQEEIKQEEEKRKFPLQVIEEIIEQKKEKISRNRYSKSIPLARFYDEEKIKMLEPILWALHDLSKRVDTLEKRI